MINKKHITYYQKHYKMNCVNHLMTIDLNDIQV